MTDWPLRYAGVAQRVRAGAAAAAPLLAGFNTCVDAIHRLDPAALDVLDGQTAGNGTPVAAFARAVLDRIRAGRGGELRAPAGAALRSWLDTGLGPPAGAQVGGTGAQACWSLAVLGAPSVLALADRSRAQLDVLHPAIGLCTPHGPTTVGRTTGTGAPAKPAHHILEFTAGTRWRGGTVPRSSRIIVRLADDGIERDGAFAAAALAGTAGAGLVSGLNAVAEGDTASRAWVRGVVAGWRAAGLATIHLELAEYPRPGALAQVVREYAGLVDSLGLSLSELRSMGGATDPAAAARDLAARCGLRRVCVHADAWALTVHRGDPEPEVAALLLGNLLAAARARHGAPTARLELDPGATFTADRPAGATLGDGWRAQSVPAPYLARPAATIGLGDTFVAGLLLAGCLSAGRLPAGDNRTTTNGEPW